MSAPISSHVSLPVHHDRQSAAWAVQEAETLARDRRRSAEARRRYLYAGGRVLFASLFVAAGLVKLIRFDETLRMVSSLGLTDSGLWTASAITIEIVCGVLLAAGLKVRRAAAVLLIYLALATLTVLRGPPDFGLPMATVNLALAGSLLLLISHGAGGLSADGVLRHRQGRREG
jgi:uncharacterized membrane protein YphA (DoxX/SURF4 family)